MSHNHKRYEKGCFFSYTQESLCDSHPSIQLFITMSAIFKRFCAVSLLVIFVVLLLLNQFDGRLYSQCGSLCDASVHSSGMVSESVPSHRNTIHSILREGAVEQDDDKSKMQILNSIVVDFERLLPKRYLPEFKNPCWYANYGDSDLRGSGVQQGMKNVTGAQDTSIEEGSVLHCLPYVYLLGYAKCGTTTVSRLLNIHPQYAAVTKEIQWWTKSESPPRPKDILAYLGVFNRATTAIEEDPRNVITGDCSASSAFHLPFMMNLSTTFADALPYLIHSVQPQAKLIAIVRNPVYRIRSEYYYFISHHCSKNDAAKKSLRNAEAFHKTVLNHLNAFRACMGAGGDEIFCMYSYRNWIEPESPCIQLRLEATMYYYTLSLWRQYFPRKQILIIRTEDLEADQTDVAASLYRFLGLSSLNKRRKSDLNSKQQKILKNSTSYDVMFPKTAQVLYDFFHPFNVKLAKLLQDDRFDWPSVSD